MFRSVSPSSSSALPRPEPGLESARPGLATLVHTDADVAPLVLRLTLGLVMLPHGAQKLFGWFGGFGYTATMDYFTQQVGLPALVALLVIVAESFGALGLVLGLLSRVAAFGIGVVMLGAIWIAHWQNGFFMNWSGSQAGEGFEFHLLAIGISVALVVTGSGTLSLDRVLLRRARR